MKIIPAIDLYNRKCVRLTRGNFNDITVYADPVLLAKELGKKGVQMIHLCDLNRAKDNSDINASLIDEIIKSTTCAIQIVGGIKNIEAISIYLKKGVKRVVISAGSLLSLSQDEKNTILKKYSENITVSVDGVGSKLVKNAWQDITEVNLIDTAKKLEKLGFKEIIYTDVSRDGTLTEPNFEMVKKIINVIQIPLVVAGGISAVSQLVRLKQMGAGGAIFGKALFSERLNLKEALQLC